MKPIDYGPLGAPLDPPRVEDVAAGAVLPDEEPLVVQLMAMSDARAPLDGAGFDPFGLPPPAADPLLAAGPSLRAALDRFLQSVAQAETALRSLDPNERKRVEPFTSRETRMWQRVDQLLALRDEVIAAALREGRA